MISLLVLAVLLLLACGLRRQRRGSSSQPRICSPSPTPTVRAGTVDELAFDYARAVLELDDIAEVTKSRALRALEWMILPLAGEFPIAEITPQLQAGVRAVLVSEFDGDTRAAVVVWDDLLRWGRHQVSQRRPIR